MGRDCHPAEPSLVAGYILSATDDASSCDDLVQEVFAIAYQKRDSFEIGTNFGGWLRVIARNVIRRHHERTAREPHCAQDGFGVVPASSVFRRRFEPGIALVHRK